MIDIEVDLAETTFVVNLTDWPRTSAADGPGLSLVMPSQQVVNNDVRTVTNHEEILLLRAALEAAKK